MDVNNNLKKDSDNGQSTTLQNDVPNLSNGSAGKIVTPESVQKQEFKMSGCDKSSRLSSKAQAVNEKHVETVADGAAFIQIEHLTPPLSSDSQEVDGSCSDPNSSHNVCAFLPVMVICLSELPCDVFKSFYRIQLEIHRREQLKMMLMGQTWSQMAKDKRKQIMD